MKASQIFTLSIAYLLISTPTEAEIIVDTGTPYCLPSAGGYCGGTTLANNQYALQYLAAEFTLASPTIITDMYAFIAARYNYGNTFSIVVYGDGGNIPDTSVQLFSQSVTVIDTGYDDGSGDQWQGLTGMNLALNQGEYWMALEVHDGQTYYGYATTSPYLAIPNPLAKYAFYFPANMKWVDEASKYGVRIEGNISAIPEPSSLLYFLSGISGLFYVVQKKKSTQGKAHKAN